MSRLMALALLLAVTGCQAQAEEVSAQGSALVTIHTAKYVLTAHCPSVTHAMWVEGSRTLGKVASQDCKHELSHNPGWMPADDPYDFGLTVSVFNQTSVLFLECKLISSWRTVDQGAERVEVMVACLDDPLHAAKGGAR